MLPQGGGSVMAKRFRRFATSGQASSTSEAGFSIVPSRLDRGHLRRLVVNHIFPVQVSEEELDRDEHGSKHETHAQHDARFGVEFPTQQVPGAASQRRRRRR